MRQPLSQIKIENIFIYLAFLCFIFISSYDAPFSFDVPFPAIALSVLLFILCFIPNLGSSIRLNPIIFFIIGRTVIFCANAALLGLGVTVILGELVTSLTCILVFVFISNFGETNIIKNICLMFSFVVSVQLFIGFILNGFSDKSIIVSGIGASNYAATFLVVCITYLIFAHLNKWQWLIVIFDALILLLTLSFGAYMALFIVICVFLRKQINWRNKQTRKKIFFVFVLLLFVFIAFLCSDIGKSILKKFEEKLLALFSGNWKVFGSSRIEVYSCSLRNFKEHFLFGNIINPVEIQHDHLEYYADARAHNFLLESLVRYGLCGTIFNALIFYCIIKKYRKMIVNDKSVYAAFIALVAALLHGFVEPNFFTMHFEIFIWLFIGELYFKERIAINKVGKVLYA